MTGISDEKHDARKTPPWLWGTGAVGPVLVLGLFLLWGVRAGMPLHDVLAAALAVALTQVLPGVLLWRVFRPRQGWWIEDVTMGFALGSALAMLAQLPAGLLDLWWGSALLTLSFAGLLLGLPITRRRILEAETVRLPWWWGTSVVLFSFAAVHQLWGFFRENPLHWMAGNRALYVDTYLHLSIAGALAHRGPLLTPWVKSEVLGYHYFGHAWIAQVGVTSGVELDSIMLRFMPLLMPVVICLAAGVAALRLSGKAWAGPLAAFLIMFPGVATSFGALSQRLPENPLSPSLGISVPILLALTTLLVMRWRGKTLSGSWVLVLVLATVAAGTKGSTTPLLVAGTAVAVLAMLVFQRSHLVLMLVDLGLLVLGLTLAYVVIFRGSARGLHFGLEDAAAQTPLAAHIGAGGVGVQLFEGATTVIGCASIGALGILVTAFSSWRTSPVGWLLGGAGLAGAGAVAVTSQPGHSQYYFALSAIPLLAVGSACAMVVLAGVWTKRTFVQVIGVGVAAGVTATYLPGWLHGNLAHGQSVGVALALTGTFAGVIAVAMVLGALLTRGNYWLAATAVLGIGLVSAAAVINTRVLIDPEPLPSPDGSVSIRHRLAVSAAEIRAARWIRDHSGVDDLVMTNRHCVTPTDPANGCESRRWSVTAYTERQVLLEGWTGTPRAAAEAPDGRDLITVAYWKPELLRLNDDFIAAPSAAAQLKLVEMGVRWVFVDFTRPHSPKLASYATLRFQAKGVRVYEMPTATPRAGSQ